jgi:hypothetical protein
MGDIGSLIETAADAQNRGVKLANNLYDARKQPGGLQKHLMTTAKQMARDEIRNAVQNGIDGAIESASTGGSFRGNGVRGGSFRGNGVRGGSFRRKSARKTISNLENSHRFTDDEKTARLQYWNPEDHNADQMTLHYEQPGFYAYRDSATRLNYA